MHVNQFPNNDTEFDEQHRTAYLIAAYIQMKLTPAEREELDDWVGCKQRKPAVVRRINRR